MCDNVGTVADINVADMVSIDQEDQLQVHLPSIGGDDGSQSKMVAEVVGTEEPSKGRKHKAPLVTKEYNLRHRQYDEVQRDSVPTHRPGPSLVIPEDKSTRLLQAMRNIARERWADCVDDLPPKHGYGEDWLVLLELKVEAAGAGFTWASRRSGHGLITSKLDRVLAHESFISHWDSVSATVLARAASDHHPILLHCALTSQHVPRPFKFQTPWTLDSRFLDVVRLSWSQPLQASDPITMVICKLRRLKQTLKLWNKTEFGNLTVNIAAARTTLAEIQEQIYSMGDSAELFDSEIEATVELHRLLNQEHSLFAQKNRAAWLKDRDRNIGFFQRLHRLKKARPGIHAMYVCGQLCTEPEIIRLHIEQFYTSLFSSPAAPCDLGAVFDLVAPSITAAQCGALNFIPAFDEIKGVIFSLSGNSAPGPDGFGGIFLSSRNARCLKDILDKYASLSGQVFNPDKSKAYFSKHVSSQNKAYFKATLSIGSAALSLTYLGVPLFKGAHKAAHLRGTTDRIIAKFTGWKGPSLSMACQACLVNSVIMSSLVHSMMIYKWPRSLLHKIDKAMRNFIWTGSTERTGFCTVQWSKVCAPKQEGGLGICNIKTANDAFLQWLAWHIINGVEPSKSFVRARFFRSKRSRTQYITSSVWRGVFNQTVRILKDARWILGKHSSVNFWLDNWLGYTLADRLGIPHFVREFLDYSVANYYFNGAWHLDDFFVMKHLDIVQDILNYSCEADEDTLVWPLELHGSLSAKGAYRTAQHHFWEVSWVKWIWGSFIHAK
ncbi:hypothetical protein ACS0TY_030000 [Phlomoides rotata]